MNINVPTTVSPAPSRTSSLRGLQEAWMPNGHPSLTMQRMIVVGTILSILVAWCFRPAFIPGPAEVLEAFPGLIDQGLFVQLYTSLSTSLQAIGLSCLLTIPLAYLTVLPAVRPFVRALCKMRFVGLTGFVILFTIFFGGGHGLKLALLVFGMSAFLVTTLYEIVEQIPREEFDHARTLRMGPWGSVLEVVIIGRFDQVLDAIRQNAAMAWVMLTMVEGLVRFEGGLGALMLAEDKHIRLDAVFAVQLVVLFIGIVQDWALLLIRKLLCPYAALTLERQ
jgi:NitT/TauT family transport system permease protein